MTGEETARRPAAVVLGIFAEHPHGVIFIERASHLRHHAGQIGLPGGGMDAADRGDLRATAAREMEEELGVVRSRLTFVAELPKISARVNNYAVTPFVAVVSRGELRIDATETVGVFTVPLAMVLDELREGSVTIGSVEIDTPLLQYGERRIWGLTGYILRSFVERWNEPSSDVRAAVEALLESQG